MKAEGIGTAAVAIVFIVVHRFFYFLFDVIQPAVFRAYDT